MTATSQILGETEKGRQKIRDIQTIALQGPRRYAPVKVIAEDGLYGIGKAYGSPGVGVKGADRVDQAVAGRTGPAGD